MTSITVMKTKKEQIIEWGRKNGTHTKLTMDLLKQLRTQEQELTDKVYEFIGNHLNDEQKMMDFARHHYDGYLKNDPDYPTFESWFTGCIYDMSSKCWKEGVESLLGEMYHNGELDQYLQDIKLSEFINSMDGKLQVHMGYTEGSWIIIDTRVHIEVNIMAD